MDSSKVGVLTEQGFAVGSGYGFNEATKEDKEKLREEMEKGNKK